MDHDTGIVIAWWQLAMVANGVISAAYLAISLLILVPTARARQLGSNKLAVATALIFFSCSVGHGLHALQPILALASGPRQDVVLSDTWWLSSWHMFTAAVAVYFLTLRKLYGRLLTSAPPPEVVDEQQRNTDLEQIALTDAARAQAELERDAHAAMLQAIIQNSQSIIYVKDLSGRFLLTNRLLEESVGLPEGGLIGCTDDTLDPDTAPLWRANDLAARQGPMEFVEWRDTPSGRVYYESVKFPLRDQTGEVYATCGISLDVTEKHKAAAQALERDAALAANAAKSAFLATMSHEIRTPMNAVIGMTDLLRKSDLNDQEREFVDTIRVSGDALLALINDILDFSKIESGAFDLEALPFDLRARAEASLDLVLPAATRKGLELVCDVDQRCPDLVVGDVHRFGQILANLLSNAVKFTERGEVVLTMQTIPIGVDRVRVLATVRDTGMGIAPEHVGRLFQAFTQADVSTTRVHGGTGLGLAISRRLAEAMDGELTLESSGPDGSTFLLDVVLDCLPSAPAGIDQAGAPTVPNLVGRSILLVDDNHTNLRIIEYQMGILGLSCLTFDSPREALRQVREGLSYDVAVLDMHMPEMDGVTLGAALREIPHVHDSPLVLLTSLGYQPAGLERSFAAFLTKPAKRALLHETVIGVLDSSPEPAPRPTPADETPSTPPLRVLLAEDNLINQRVAKLMLEELGHQVDTAANGFEAVNLVTDGDYDVVLMDVQMPEVDGLEATRRIRSRMPRERTPYIVAMTANAMREDRDACIAAGMHDYISKPVRLQELEVVLARTGETVSPAPAPDTQVAIDEDVLAALLRQMGGADEEVHAELVEQYLTEAGNQAALLRDLVAAANHPAIKSLAHTWRSTSALFGAARLATKLKTLEDAAQDASDSTPAAAQDVAEEFARVKNALVCLQPAAHG